MSIVLQPTEKGPIDTASNLSSVPPVPTVPAGQIARSWPICNANPSSHICCSPPSSGPKGASSPSIPDLYACVSHSVSNRFRVSGSQSQGSGRYEPSFFARYISCVRVLAGAPLSIGHLTARTHEEPHAGAQTCRAEAVEWWHMWPKVPGEAPGWLRSHGVSSINRSMVGQLAGGGWCLLRVWSRGPCWVPDERSSVSLQVMSQCPGKPAASPRSFQRMARAPPPGRLAPPMLACTAAL